MLVELGNHAPKQLVGDREQRLDGLRVTYVNFDDEVYPLDVGHGLAVADIGLHIAQTDAVTHLPGLEPFLAIANRPGAWADLGHGAPAWVRVSGHDDKAAQHREFERLLSEFYNTEIAPPAGADLAWERQLEDNYFTSNGMPGVGFDPLGGVTALKPNAGNDIQAWQMFGHTTVFGQSGTATATSATTLTGGTETPGGSHGTNDAAGMILVAGAAYGLVLSNTSGTTPVYTVDRWYAPGTPGGAAAATPGSTATYVLIAGSPPAWFMGLTATATAPGSGDTTLAGEITTASGGLIRKICPLAHSAGTNTQTLVPVFTANGSDSLPVTVAKIGVSQSLLSGANQLFQTLLNATATLSASGDQLTVTETVTM